MGVRAWVRDRSLGLVFIGLFLLTWLGQLVVQWFEFRGLEEHGTRSDFWFSFGQATLENWQSEFLQVASFVIATAYFVYKGSSESGDSDERVEAKLDALLRERGIDPEALELALPLKHQRLERERVEHRIASTSTDLTDGSG